MSRKHSKFFQINALAKNGWSLQELHDKLNGLAKDTIRMLGHGEDVSNGHLQALQMVFTSIHPRRKLEYEPVDLGVGDKATPREVMTATIEKMHKGEIAPDVADSIINTMVKADEYLTLSDRVKRLEELAKHADEEQAR